MTNQRVLKFRAWDGHLGFMVDPSSYRIHLDGKVFFDNDGEYYNQSEKLHVMQWTGLQDSEGVDIYESDILKDQKGELWVVKTEPGRHYIESVESADCNFIAVKNFFSVVGNVFEHPDLIPREGD